MSDTIARYPLQWPVGWKRTSVRIGAAFHSRGKRLTVAQGVERVIAELRRMGIPEHDVVVSTNVPTRLDGLPRSDQAEPTDTGAAVYWRDKGSTRVMAIDRYYRVADNLAALAATFDAMRAIERHGGAIVLERAFAGFAALPAPGGRDWQAVLGLQELLRPTLEDARKAYRRLAAERHPDRPGGSSSAMAELNRAWEQAQAELG